MAISAQEDVFEALKQVFGGINRAGALRTGYLAFGPNDTPNPFGSPAGTVKTLSQGRLFVEHALILNAQRDQSSNATAGNFAVVGDEGDQLFELPVGGAVEVDWVDLSKVYVGYIGTQLTAGQVVVVRYIAHGRVLRDEV